MKTTNNNIQQKGRGSDSKNANTNKRHSSKNEKSLVEIPATAINDFIESPLGVKIARIKSFDHIRLNLETAESMRSEVLKRKNELEALRAEAEILDIQIDGNGSLSLPKTNAKLGGIFDENIFYLSQLEKSLEIDVIKINKLLKFEKLFAALDESYQCFLESAIDRVSILDLVKKTGISRNEVIEILESLYGSYR
jgi:hypothetical protein